MKIIVYGLGIIGASLCAACKRAGHTVYGKNRSKDSIAYALEHKMIDGVAETYEGADVVFLALPPRVTMKELDEGAFPSGIIVSDICGVKLPPEETVFSKPRDYRYVGIHPMAGKETSGITSASLTLFDSANLIVTERADTDKEALSVILRLAKEIGFGNVVRCTAKYHDEMIALTSQLAHVVSNAYVKSPLTDSCEGFTGGSFQDMTRIAGVDENVWSELFFLNADPLRAELNRLITSLKAYETALERGDEEGMKALLREGKEYRRKFVLHK